LHFSENPAKAISVQDSMKIGLHLIRPAIVLILAVFGWWTVMFWSHPMERAPGPMDLAPDLSYGYPWEFGIDRCDVAGGLYGIDVWKPRYFILDGLIWAAVIGLAAMVLNWVMKVANPNG
jgi:hypothetical protein